MVFLQLLLWAVAKGHYYYDYGYWEINEPSPLCSDYEMLVVNTHQTSSAGARTELPPS